MKRTENLLVASLIFVMNMENRNFNKFIVRRYEPWRKEYGGKCKHLVGADIHMNELSVSTIKSCSSKYFFRILSFKNFTN